MSISAETTVPKRQSSGVLPPWLWFWLILYILGFSTTIDMVKVNLHILLFGSDGTTPIQYMPLARVPTIAELALSSALFLGVVTVFLPWLRATYLERRYKLTELSMLPSITPEITLQTLKEISDFLQENAPGVPLKYGLSPGLHDDAFVYPLDYRRTAIAVSSRLLPLWRKDRQTAEAVLLHEIAHYRHGDTLIVGTGSLIRTVIDHWLLLNGIFFFIPLILSIIIQDISSVHEGLALQLPLSSLILHDVQEIFTLDLPFILLGFFQSLFWTASVFTLVVAATWCTEFNADRFVIDTTASASSLTQVLRQHTVSVSRWNWLLSRLSHPPQKMRQWMVLQTRGVTRLTLLLLLFPIAFFIKLLFLSGWALSLSLSFLYTGSSIGNILGQLGIDVIYGLEALVPSWIAIAMLLLLWPILAPHWERLFGRILGRLARAKYRPYLMSTGIVVCVCAIGLTLSEVPLLTNKTSTPESGSSSGVTKHFRVGDQVKVDDTWIVTISSVQINPSSDILTPKPGNVFLVIDASLKNISSQQHNLDSAIQFILKDPGGKQYHETYIGAVQQPEVYSPTHDGNIEAGITVHGQLDYEVPASIHQFTLSFMADWMNYDSATSKLTIWDINLVSHGPSPQVDPTPSALVPTSTHPTPVQTYNGNVTLSRLVIVLQIDTG